MRLSLKNMIISFALALVAFSLVMTVVCVSIYRSQIPVRAEGNDDPITALPSQTSRYDFSQTLLYYDTDAEYQFRFAVFVGISDSRKTVTVTPIFDTLPVNYKNGIYYVSSIYQTEREVMLPSLAEALFGISPDQTIDLGMFGFAAAEDFDGFYEQVQSHVRNVMRDAYADYTVKRIDVVLDENGVADNQKTVEQFFITETK